VYRYEGSIFLEFVCVVAGAEGGVARVGELPSETSRTFASAERAGAGGLVRWGADLRAVTSQPLDVAEGVKEEEMFVIFSAHARETLAAEHPEWGPQAVESEVHSPYALLLYCLFKRMYCTRS
jgi:hypothetical protein